MNSAASNPGPGARRLILAGLGLVFGGGLGYAVGRLIKSGVLSADGLGWSDIAAAAIAVCLLAMGVVIGAASFSRVAAGRMIDARSGRPATPAQQSFYRQQAIVLALAGIMMAAPVATVAVFGKVPEPLGSIVMLGVIAVFLVQTAFNLTVWRRGDEMMRQVISETGAVCFWILQGLLFLWAAAEKLGLAPALSAWDIMTILMGVYLVISSLMSIRRGLA
ncbi:MAG: hypothetical protein GC145_15605 [Caulobacter sp.]|nr:hypothetical protein [Caulobacter sp.]